MLYLKVHINFHMNTYNHKLTNFKQNILSKNFSYSEQSFYITIMNCWRQNQENNLIYSIFQRRIAKNEDSQACERSIQLSCESFMCIYKPTLSI